MKKILITGKNSYIGISVEDWLGKYKDRYVIGTVDTKSDDWKKEDFSKYDLVFHVAGIAHVTTDSKMKDLYYKVNTQLTLEAAKKAKAEGVKQFIFMSSIIVYGDSTRGQEVINKDTVPKPSNVYGIA